MDIWLKYTFDPLTSKKLRILRIIKKNTRRPNLLLFFKGVKEHIFLNIEGQNCYFFGFTTFGKVRGKNS